MIFVPLPFVVALLLSLNLVMLLKTLSWRRVSKAFLALMGMTILQSIMSSLRWGYDITEFRYVLPVTASFLPPLLLASFYTLAGDPVIHRLPGWTVMLFPLLIIILLIIRPQLTDAALIMIFILHAVLLLDLSWQGPDLLKESRLNESVSVSRSLIIAAFSLCMSALFDLSVLLDFEWGRGKQASVIMSVGNLLGLLLIGLTARVTARAKVEGNENIFAVNDCLLNSESSEDVAIITRIDSLLDAQKLYLDPDLTLSRLARRMGLPSRQISGVINRARSKNVSQYVNEFRISEACRRLKAGSSVTEAMLSSGFQTKSNFNREFRRITGFSPTEWKIRQKVND